MAEARVKHNYTGIFGFFLLVLSIFMLGLEQGGIAVTVIGVGLLVLIRSLSLFTIGQFSLGWFSRWTLRGLSVLGVLVGVLVFISPLFSLIAVGVLVSIGFLLLGVSDVVRAISPIVVGTNRWVALLVALLSFLVIGFLLSATDVFGLIQPTATYAFIVGILDLVFGVAYGGGEFERARIAQTTRAARQRMPRPRPA